MTKLIWRSFTHQFHNLDISLLKGSMLISFGTVAARVLGLAFSLTLAAAFSADAYGEIRYSIAVASIVAMGTMPFGQHVLARFVSRYRSDESKLDAVLSDSLVILPGLFVLTLLIAMPILLGLGKFNIGILAIFLGETLFYTYWGLSSGFMEPKRLMTAYLGSNLIQILLVFVLIQWLGIHSATLALLIYGLSYLLPLALLTIFKPLPGHIRFGLFDLGMLKELLRFAVPIWVSHICYTLSLSFDFLILEQTGSVNELGAYSLSKTLSGLFLIVPTSISTLLMPRVASIPQAEHRQALNRMLLLSTLINAFFLTLYLALIQPLTLHVFGADYLMPMGVSVLLSLYMIACGVHGLVTAVFVGSGRPQVESISRVLELLTTAVSCWLLIPGFGALGAAGAMLAGKTLSLLSYVVLGGKRFSGFIQKLSVLSAEPAER